MDVNVLKYKYKIHFKPHYIHNQLFEDVVLLSRDGKEFNLNVCIFASLSKLCRQLAEGVSRGSIRVHTELSYLELYKVVTFAKTGCLRGYQSREELEPRTLANFKDFGVNLFHLRFTGKFVEHKKLRLDINQIHKKYRKGTHCFQFPLQEKGLSAYWSMRF